MGILYVNPMGQLWLTDLDGLEQRFVADLGRAEMLYPVDYDVILNGQQVVVLLADTSNQPPPNPLGNSNC